MSFKISIIMPTYNAGKQLNRTIKSVINQSIQFIIVDDCSKDDTREIIKSYCKKYENIVPYFSKTNHGGPGFGRNMGLKLATSNYIMFIDNDDEYDENLCKKLYETLITENADIVGCNKISVDNISNIKQHIYYKNGIEKEDKVIIKDDDILFFDSVAVWNKIYKKEIIEKNRLTFLEDTRADDFAFTMDYYLNSKKLIYLKNYHGYYWNIKSDSLSHIVTKKHIKELIRAYTYTYNQLKNKNKEQHMDDLIKGHISYLITQSSYFDFENDEIKNVLTEIYDFEKEINFNTDLNEKWLDILNKLILKEHYTIVIMLLKSIAKLRNITILRKINRKL